MTARHSTGDGREIEFKLALADEGEASRLLAELGIEDPWAREPATQVNHFFDTADERLVAAAYALRLREEGARRILTAKGGGRASAGGALVERAETELDVDAERAARVLAGALDPLELFEALLGERGTESELVGRMRAAVGDAPLRELGAFTNERRRVGPLALPGGPEARYLLELDRTEFPGGRIAHELEIEVAAADAPAVEAALRALLARAGLAWRTAPSKYERFRASLASE